MEYVEFSNLEFKFNSKYKTVKEYFLDKNSSFLIEPTFYTQLEGMKRIHPNSFQKIIDEMKSIVKKNRKVIFCGDFENPYIDLEGYIYREISDICDPLHIFVEDKSRGSDYGD